MGFVKLLASLSANQRLRSVLWEVYNNLASKKCMILQTFWVWNVCKTNYWQEFYPVILLKINQN